MDRPEKKNGFFVNDIRAWFVTGYLPPEYSGAGRNDSLLGVSCSRQNIEVTFLAPRSRQVKSHATQDGISVYWLRGGYSVYDRISRLARIICAFDVLGTPDIIRMRGFSIERASLLLLIKLRRARVPIVVQPAMLGGDDPASLSKKRFGNFQVKQLLKADAIFAMNVQIFEQLVERGYPKEAIYRTRNPVGREFFVERSIDERLAARKKLGIAEAAVIVATVGVILPRKRQAFVTEGFCQALDQCDSEDKILVHVGPGATDSLMDGRPDQARESQTEEASVVSIMNRFQRSTSVSLLGEREDIAAVIGAVDILVHASTEEGEANVVNEAAAAGVSVVIPTSSVYDDQVPEAYPWRFDADSSWDLSRLLVRLMTNASLRAEAGRALRNHARQYRSEEAVGKEYAEMLRAVVDRQRSGAHNDR